jgi:uncharacterized protein (UPF0371 family)
MVKKTWTTPELIVLVRSKPEEGVLAVCKSGMSHTGNAGTDSSCRYSSAPCLDCSLNSPS